MAVDLVQYADIYQDVRMDVVPGIRRTGADPEDKEAITYAIYTVTYDPRTGQPLPPEVVGVNRLAVLAQIAGWEREIEVRKQRIWNSLLFLQDADAAPLGEL